MVARLVLEADDLQAKWDQTGCSAALVEARAEVCVVQARTFGLLGGLAAQEILASIKPSSKNFVAERVPAELVEPFSRVARTGVADWKAAEAIACPGEQCRETTLAAERAWQDLRKALVEWEPYLSADAATAAKFADDAAVVSRMVADIERAAAAKNAASCPSSTLAAGDQKCVAIVQMMRSAVGSAAVIWSSAYREVPAEVAKLRDRTGKALQAADTTAMKMTCPGADCEVTAADFYDAWRDLRRVLAEWRPYLPAEGD